MVGSGSDTVAQNLYNLNTKSRIVVWFLIHRSSIVTPEESQRLTSSPQTFYVPGQLTVTVE